MRRRAEIEAARRDLHQAHSERDECRREMVEAVASVDRLRVAFDALPLGVVVVDNDGVEQLRNAEAARLADARHADALAARALNDMLVEAASRETSRVIELHGPPPRTLSFAGAPLTSASGYAGTVAVVQDVTERYRLEAVRRDFVANVSHELRTPIGAIVALADTLAAEDAESEPEVFRRLAARIAHEADRAGHLIDDLLDLSRIEGGELEREEVTIRDLVMRAVGRVAANAGDRASDLSVVGNLPAGTLLVDAVQIDAALVNVIENAIKYSDPGASVEVSATDDGVDVDFVVADHGIGIPPTDRDRIFERFYRVDRARSRVTGGTGLGLAIVRNVARNHGGEVLVDSREGEGSRFVIHLPRNSGGQTPGRDS